METSTPTTSPELKKYAIALADFHKEEVHLIVVLSTSELNAVINCDQLTKFFGTIDAYLEDITSLEELNESLGEVDCVLTVMEIST